MKNKLYNKITCKISLIGILISLVSFSFVGCNKDLEKNNSITSNVISKTQEKQEVSKTIEINTVEDLIKMSNDINENGAMRIDYVYKLNSDLDFKDIIFPPIGQNKEVGNEGNIDDSNAGFMSTFDGQGHTITNLNLYTNKPLEPGLVAGLGLFYRIGKDGIVKNLNIKNCSVIVEGSDTAVGIVAGRCAGKIINCHVQGKVTGMFSVGGIVGMVSGGIADDNSLKQENYAQVVDCTANIDVVGTGSLGGLVGSVGFVKILNCKASGTVTAHKTNLFDIDFLPSKVGGFAGEAYNAIFTNCDSSVSVKINNIGDSIGEFIGSVFNFQTEKCTYDVKKIAKWDIIDVDDYKNITDYSGYDVKPR